MQRRRLLQTAAATLPTVSAGCLAMLGSSESSGPEESSEDKGWPMVAGGSGLRNSRSSFGPGATAAPTRMIGWQEGYESTPASDGEALYFVRSEESSVLARIDPSDGTEAWNTELNIPETRSVPPAIHDGTAFVPSFGGIAAVETDSGEVAWSTDEVVAASAPPTVADGSLYVVYGTEVRNPVGVAALSTDDGSVEWTAPGEFRGPAAVGDGMLVVRAHENGTAALDTETGEVLWESSEHEFDTPLSVADRYAVGVSGGGTVARLDIETGETRWTRGVDAEYEPGIAIAGEEVFIHHDDGITGYALEDATVTTEVEYLGAAGPLVVADDGFLIGTWDGEAALVDREGTPQWVITVRRVMQEDVPRQAVYSVLHDGSRAVVSSYGGDTYVSNESGSGTETGST